MIIGQGQNNMVYGQFEESEYRLLQNIVMKMNGREIVFRDETDAEQFKMLVENGILKYSLYSNGQWQPPQSVTDPAVDPGDSTMLPFNLANTRIVIENSLFRVYLDGVLKTQISATQMYQQLNEWLVDNQVGDLTIKMATQLG